jgi:hypothetical protein
LFRRGQAYFAAGQVRSPDQIQLAERLVARALKSPLEVFLTVLPGYREGLGQAGMARYGELVDPARDDSPGYTAKCLMERLAEREGGVDALIKVLSRDVSHAYDVLRIAECLCQEGRGEAAPEWLQRGMQEFPPDRGLRSLAASCHLTAGRRTEACDLL